MPIVKFQIAQLQLVFVVVYINIYIFFFFFLPLDESAVVLHALLRKYVISRENTSEKLTNAARGFSVN